MVNKAELKAAIARKGLRQSDVAKELGISERAFSSKINKGVFWSDEIEVMISLLDITDPLPVFFDGSVTS